VQVYAVLSAVERAIARHELTGPLSGADHAAFREAVSSGAAGSVVLTQDLSGE